jgi:DNA polymerase III subunit delta'
MHAYLLIGQGITNLQLSISNLAKERNAKIINFPLVKIDDVRNLNDLLRLSFSEPTLIVSENIEEAGEEALNAFLKNLEEPQENIYFALTASSLRKVLPTIVSRCQVIKITNDKLQMPNDNKEEVEKFLSGDSSQRLAFFDKTILAISSKNGKMNSRDKAIDFIESLIFFLHAKHNLTNMELLLKTLTGLKSNGNVNLQLLNLITNYGE